MYILPTLTLVNSSATKQLLDRAVGFLKSNDLQAYFQSLSDAIEVNKGFDQDEDPDRFAIEFDRLDQRMRKNA